MLTYQAIILGVIQGLTEFIPVSSTAHLTLVGRLMGVVKFDTPDASEAWTAFIAVIQMGTLLAAVAYFLPDIAHLTGGFVATNLSYLTGSEIGTGQRAWARLGWLLLAGSVPIGIAGLVFRNRVQGNMTKSPRVIVVAILAVSALMAIADSSPAQNRETADLGTGDAIVVGVSQVLALVPGASRSGATIAAGLLRGMSRETAARFSFLLMIPAVAASGLFKLPAAVRSINAGALQIAAGLLGAGVSGYLAIAFMLGYLQTHTIVPFVIYRLTLAALIWCLLLTGRLKSA